MAPASAPQSFAPAAAAPATDVDARWREYFSDYMINLGDEKAEPITFEKMCNDIGDAMPARKAVQGPAPSMPRLAARTYQEPHCDTASDWVSQRPLAMLPP